MNSAKRVESSPNADSQGEAAAYETYSSESVPNAVKEVTSVTTLQGSANAKWNEYSKAGFRKFLVVHQKRVGKRAEACATMGSPRAFHGKAVEGYVNKWDESCWSSKLSAVHKHTPDGSGELLLLMNVP